MKSLSHRAYLMGLANCSMQWTVRAGGRLLSSTSASCSRNSRSFSSSTPVERQTAHGYFSRQHRNFNKVLAVEVGILGDLNNVCFLNHTGNAGFARRF